MSSNQSTKLYTKDECAPDAQPALEWLANHLNIQPHALEARQYVRTCSQWNDISEYYLIGGRLYRVDFFNDAREQEVYAVTLNHMLDDVAHSIEQLEPLLSKEIEISPA